MDKIKVAFITRSPFGTMGSAASYRLPTLVAEYCDVLVLSPKCQSSMEKILPINSSINKRHLEGATEKTFIAAAKLQLKQFNPDIVHVFHSPYCFALLKLVTKELPNAKRILDFRSPITTQKKTVRRRLLKKYFLAQFLADQLITHSLLTLRQNIPALLNKTIIELPPGVDLDKYLERQETSLEVTRLVFIGSVSKSRRIVELIEYFRSFQNSTENAVFLDIIGDGNDLVNLRKHVEHESYSNIKLLGPKSDIPKILRKYDFGLAFVPNGNVEKAPSLKSLEYAAAKLPILASRTEGHLDLVERFGLKMILFENSEAGFSKGMKDAIKAKQRSLDTAGNFNAVRKLDWRHMVENILLPSYKALVNIKRHKSMASKFLEKLVVLIK